MESRLRFLIEKNQANLRRKQEFDSFSAAWSRCVEFPMESIHFASFEESQRLVEEARAVVTDFPVGCSWNGFHIESFKERIDCCSRAIQDVECYVLLSQRYDFMGAMKLSLHSVLRNILGFLSMGEETLLIIDRLSRNHLVVDSGEDSLTRQTYYSIRSMGPSWPLVLQTCLPDEASR